MRRERHDSPKELWTCFNFRILQLPLQYFCVDADEIGSTLHEFSIVCSTFFNEQCDGPMSECKKMFCEGHTRHANETGSGRGMSEERI